MKIILGHGFGYEKWLNRGNWDYYLLIIIMITYNRTGSDIWWGSGIGSLLFILPSYWLVGSCNIRTNSRNKTWLLPINLDDLLDINKRMIFIYLLNLHIWRIKVQYTYENKHQYRTSIIKSINKLVLKYNI